MLSSKKIYHRTCVLSFSYTGFAAAYIGRIIKSITSSFNTEFDLDQVGKTISVRSKLKHCPCYFS